MTQHQNYYLTEKFTDANHSQPSGFFTPINNNKPNKQNVVYPQTLTRVGFSSLVSNVNKKVLII